MLRATHRSQKPQKATTSHSEPRRATEKSHREPHLEKKKKMSHHQHFVIGQGLDWLVAAPFPSLWWWFAFTSPLRWSFALTPPPAAVHTPLSHPPPTWQGVRHHLPPRSGVKSLPIWSFSWLRTPSGGSLRPHRWRFPSSSSWSGGVSPPVASSFSRWTRFDPVPSPSAVGHPPIPLMGYFAISFFSLACSIFFEEISKWVVCVILF